MKRTAAVLLASALALATAQTANPTNRIIRFDSSARVQGDLRNGPYEYAATAGTIRATVGNVQIAAPRATLRAPQGVTMAAAEGRRVAQFAGTVQVQRGRLAARGETLVYSEATGQGVLSGTPQAIFSPERGSDQDPVQIRANQMSLDVDSNVSTSTGNVRLVSGAQSGSSDRLVFDETRELGVLTGNLRLARAGAEGRRPLTMTGQEARVLTKNRLMYVRGGVRLVQDGVSTSGDALYYDDDNNVAYVIGNAVSVDTARGATIRGNVLEQRTDLARVRVLTAPVNLNLEQFGLPRP